MSSRRLNLRFATTLAGVLFLCLPPATAAAQDDAGRISGEALFDEGRALAKQGKLAEACVKFAESQRLAPAVGTLLNLGDCLEKTNRIASAWAAFREGAALASHVGQDDRAEYARGRAAKLASRLARLRVDVPDEVKLQGLEVRRDGHALSAAEWGVAVPVDEGTVTVTVSAPGKKPWTTSIAVAEAASVAVTVPALAEAERVAADAPAPATSPPADTAAQPTASPSSSGAVQRTLGIVLAGVGVIGVVAGSVTGLIAKSKNDDALSHCTGSFCDATGLSLTSDAKGAATMSTVAFVVGALSLGGGAVLWFTAPRPSGTPAAGTSPRLRAGASIDPSGARVGLRGEW